MELTGVPGSLIASRISINLFSVCLFATKLPLTFKQPDRNLRLLADDPEEDTCKGRCQGSTAR